MKQTVNSNQSTGLITHFIHLNAWKVNHKLTLLVYRVTQIFPKDDYIKLKMLVFDGYKLINGLIRSVAKVNNKN